MYKVLIVDDMEILRRDVKRLKIWGEKSGFTITDEAEDGMEALKKLEANPVDLVITDIRMPNMDGIELLRNISEKKLCPFTVLLSDFTEYNYARQAFVYGAFDYLGKPVNEKEIADLLERIRNSIEEKQREEQKLIELQTAAEDIKQIAVMICQGDEKAVPLTAAMIEAVEISFDHDKRKALWVLKNAVNEIINETLKTYGWLADYVDVDSLKNTDFTSCGNWEEIKAAVTAAEKKLISTVLKFIGNHDSKIVKQACEYVLEHIDGELSVRMLSEKLFISKSHLSDIFKQNLGLSLLEYMTMIKMERAKKLLLEENLKNYEIAYKLGFQDHEYFSRVFKKHTGLSLTEFRHRGHNMQ